MSVFRCISLVILLALLPLLSHATITVNGVDANTASRVDHDTTANTLIIYGGVAGTCDSGSLLTDQTCDSCDGGILACNKTRIHSSLRLRIEFKSDSADGYPVLLFDGNPVTTTGSTSSSTVAKGNTAVIEVEWSVLCGHIINEDCDASSLTNDNDAKAFTLGIGESSSDTSLEDSIPINIKVHNPEAGDPNADSADRCDTSGTVPESGVCDFVAFPGDGKIYIDDVEYGDSFPNTDGITFHTVRVFYLESPSGGFDDIDNTTGYSDIAIAEDSGGFYLQNNIIKDLTNYSQYFLRVGVVDQANNVSYITNNSAITTACGGTGPSPSNECTFVATPDPVLGLLPEDFNCFVATAAYGSPFATKVKTLRQFRDRFLMKTKWGRNFVDFYYSVGPSMAHFIAKSENLRFFTRAALWPAWFFAWLSLKIGVVLTTILFSLAFLTPAVLFLLRRVRLQLEGLAQ